MPGAWRFMNEILESTFLNAEIKTIAECIQFAITFVFKAEEERIRAEEEHRLEQEQIEKKKQEQIAKLFAKEHIDKLEKEQLTKMKENKEKQVY